METQRLVIGVGAFIAIVAIMWWTRDKKTKVLTFTEKLNDRKITTLQEEFPYWGRGVNVHLRCSRPNNTGCDVEYDSRGSLRRIHDTL